MSGSWGDPLEDALLQAANVDGAVNDIDEILEKMERAKEELNGESVEIIEDFIELAVMANNLKQKTRELESEFEDYT